jgi:hypothetical protein
MSLTIEVDMNKHCAECGKGGAAQNGLCMSCSGRALSGRVMKSEIGKAVQKRMFELLGKAREARRPR